MNGRERGVRWLSRRQAIGVVAVVGYCASFLLLALLTYCGDLRHSEYIPVPLVAGSLQWGLKGGVMVAACWLALGDGSWLMRLATCASVLVWISIVWLASLNLARFEGPPIGSWGYYPLLHIPYLFVPLAALLTAGRVLWGLAFVADTSQPLVAAPRQFSLAQILLVVAACAATLGAIRLIAPRDLVGLAWWKQLDFHQNAMLWCPVEAATSVPTALILVFRRRWWPAAILYFPLAAIVGTLFQRFVWVGPGAWQRLDFYALVTIEAAIVSLAGLIWFFAALWLMGYRMNRQSMTTAASTPAV
jgi:hypothetical protein